MKIEAKINTISYDNIKTIKECIDDDYKFQLMAYKAELNEEDGSASDGVGLWVESVIQEKDCTIMIDMTKEEALFFAKSLTALAESL